ncbi:MAG: sulfide-dependent adenosine diphosphate thiazole synthase [bacterium]
MPISETIVTEAIVQTYTKRFLGSLELDVAIVGGGPSGLVAAKILAENGAKTALFERKLSIGGGMWGGGMGYNVIVVQEGAKRLLDAFGIRSEKYKDEYYTADSVESVAKLVAGAKDAGAEIFNLISVEDVVAKGGKVCGLVINRSPIEMAQLHVDPITIGTKFVIDATGHPAEVARVIEKKVGPLKTKTKGIVGERAMFAEDGERFVVEKAGEIFPNVYVAGMSVGAVFGGPRMGPIFGGMLLSGERVAQLVLKRLKK